MFAVVERMLNRIGLDSSALRCGVHWPIHQPSAQALARAGGTATAVHNNCSGKHAGFLCVRLRHRRRSGAPTCSLCIRCSGW